MGRVHTLPVVLWQKKLDNNDTQEENCGVFSFGNTISGDVIIREFDE